MATIRTTFPATITASTWATAWQAAFTKSLARYGERKSSDGTLAPALTYAELSSLVRAWRMAAGASAFPLWSQWAALAYDWDPAKPAVLTTTTARARTFMDAELSKEFWTETHRLALGLDDTATGGAKLDVDVGAFGDPMWQAMVTVDLSSDAGTSGWKIPVGCKNRKTGKTRPAHLGCKPGWSQKPITAGSPLMHCVNDKTGETRPLERICDGDEIAVRDPITAAKDSLIRGLLIVGGLWWLWKQSTRPSNRASRRTTGGNRYGT